VHADDISSIALVTEGRHWVKSQAVLNIAKGMKPPIDALAKLANVFHEDVRNVVYDFVAEERYDLFGESDTCRLMRPEWRERFLV
jgi:predicted DCC family thiol-disulfide oxidoreductase YuxK